MLNEKKAFGLAILLLCGVLFVILIAVLSADYACTQGGGVLTTQMVCANITNNYCISRDGYRKQAPFEAVFTLNSTGIQAK